MDHSEFLFSFFFMMSWNTFANSFLLTFPSWFLSIILMKLEGSWYF